MDAQAASVAVHDAATERLVFVAAAGPAAGDVVGLSIAADAGIAGYAFSTGQPMAVAEVSADPRFDRTVAAATGYVPGTLLATPLADDDGTVGVLEVLDRRGGPFTLADLDLAATVAQAVTVAVRRRALAHDGADLVRVRAARPRWRRRTSMPRPSTPSSARPPRVSSAMTIRRGASSTDWPASTGSTRRASSSPSTGSTRSSVAGPPGR